MNYMTYEGHCRSVVCVVVVVVVVVVFIVLVVVCVGDVIDLSTIAFFHN